MRALENSKFSLQENLTDFLGGLVPGIFFCFMLSFSLTLPLRFFLYSLTSENMGSFYRVLLNLLDKISNISGVLWVGAFSIALIVSYIIGHIFYRSDPKVANQSSFKKVTKKDKDKGSFYLKSHYCCDNEEDCEFPFPYLKDYLTLRGHKDLAKRITWEENEGARSKTFINKLKLGLIYHCPEKYGKMTRNEAHVRLACSTWYASKALIKISFYMILLSIASGLLFYLRGRFSVYALHPNLLHEFVSVSIWPITVLILSYFCKSSLENFIHYQRIREAFFVLQLAYYANNDKNCGFTWPR